MNDVNSPMEMESREREREMIIIANMKMPNFARRGRSFFVVLVGSMGISERGNSIEYIAQMEIGNGNISDTVLWSD